MYCRNCGRECKDDECEECARLLADADRSKHKEANASRCAVVCVAGIAAGAVIGLSVSAPWLILSGLSLLALYLCAERATAYEEDTEVYKAEYELRGQYKRRR